MTFIRSTLANNTSAPFGPVRTLISSLPSLPSLPSLLSPILTADPQGGSGEMAEGGGWFGCQVGRDTREAH